MSQISPPVRVYRLSHALVTASVCLIMGLGFWWLYGQIGKTRTGLGSQFDEFKRDTDRKMQELPKPEADLRAIVKEMEKKLDDTGESFELLQREVDRQGLSDALALANTADLYFRGEKIRKRLKILTDEFSEWKTRPDLLLSNDDGKRIAAVRELVGRFMTASEEACTSETDLASYQTQLDRILTPVTRAYENEDAGFEIDESWAAALGELEKKIDDAFERFDEQRLDINAIMKHAPDQAPEGTLSLLDAILAERERRRDEKAKLVEELLREERRKNAQIIVDAKAETERLVAEANAKVVRTLGEQTARHITEEAEDMARREEGRVSKRLRDLARQQLESQFQAALPEIRSLLSPFISNGRTQPAQGLFRQTTTVGPVSLSKLSAQNALNAKIEDQRRLWFMVAGHKNDRDLGGFPSYIGNASDWQAKQPTVQRAQELLNKYGELMVEKGMLAP